MKFLEIDKNRASELATLTDTVINGGYCIGCGACASISGSPLKMRLDDYGRYVATSVECPDHLSVDASIGMVCPFSDQAADEDKISQQLFGQHGKYHSQIGYYITTYAGYVLENDFRKLGSSGGMGTWIVSNLLSEGLVDGVIHVQQRCPSDTDPRLFHYQLSTNVEEVRRGAKSRYYPIEMSEVMELVRNRPGSYAIVAIPCFLKAVRLLINQDAILAERIRFCVGLVCGHLKSTEFAKMLAWQCGIEPDKLLSIDFRHKLPDADANKYGIKVVGSKDGERITHVSPVNKLYGSDWGLGFFKYKACDYCDDVVAETADVTVGDAWLPQYVKDSHGTNVVIVRNPVIHNMIEQAVAAGRLNLDRIDASEIVRSQAAGFRHRRDGLAYRLYLCDSQGVWHPKKRVLPNFSNLTRNIKKRYQMRILLAKESHLKFKEAVDADQFSLFHQNMETLVSQYRRLYQVPLWKKKMRFLLSFVSQVPRKILSRIKNIQQP